MNRNLNKQAFTIIETIIGLILVASIALLINNSIPYLNYENKTNNDNLINYHIFLKTIESKKLNLKVLNANDDTANFINYDTQKRYRISLYKNMLRLSGDKNGHVPLLDNVTNIEFKIVNHHLHLIVILKENQKFESVSSIES
ncbi:ComGF family competence protein [Apilactobacillus apisilvae]|uniref:ComGF family competence protein n=1 Tax=Apilactobacillus apisilvae TaxID=2923364 RepID=A0ABY4PI94_9LACO|nr:ComGF family competence protein [Apilactobacillus apisilvae]UQS85215.1 ComGF family competence protein [Apilactobacillus apisilvae]